LKIKKRRRKDRTTIQHEFSQKEQKTGVRSAGGFVDVYMQL